MSVTGDLLEQIRCPYCGSPVELERALPSDRREAEHGILRCACYRYPLMNGIAVLQQDVLPRPGSVRRSVEFLEDGDPESAIGSALDVERKKSTRMMLTGLERFGPGFARDFVGRHKRRFERQVVFDTSLDLRGALTHLRPRAYSDYLYCRYANPSLHAAIPVMLLLKDLYPDVAPSGSRKGGHVLDLACGLGHASFLLRRLFPALPLIAADYDFTNLYLAKRFFIPDVPCFCFDVQIGTPFPENFFEGVFSLDSFHSIQAKVTAVRQLKEAVRSDGVWLFPHLHNARIEHPVPGVPLEPDDYLSRLDLPKARLFPEAKILEEFLREDAFDLTKESTEAELAASPDLSLVGTGNGDLWRRHDGLLGHLMRAKGDLAVNPVYRIERAGDVLHLRMQWPNQSLERECELAKTYMPAQVDLETAFLDRLASGRTTQQDDSRVSDLLRTFVLVHLPRSCAEFTCGPARRPDCGNG